MKFYCQSGKCKKALTAVSTGDAANIFAHYIVATKSPFGVFIAVSEAGFMDDINPGDVYWNDVCIFRTWLLLEGIADERAKSFKECDYIYDMVITIQDAESKLPWGGFLPGLTLKQLIDQRT